MALLHKKDADRLKMIRRRVEDIYRTSRGAVVKNKFERIGLSIFAEQRFLVQIIDKLMERINAEQMSPAEFDTPDSRQSPMVDGDTGQEVEIGMEDED